MVEEIIKDILICTHKEVVLEPFTYSFGEFEHGTQVLFKLLKLIFPNEEYMEIVMKVSNKCTSSKNVLTEKDVIKYIRLKR